MKECDEGQINSSSCQCCHSTSDRKHDGNDEDGDGCGDNLSGVQGVDVSNIDDDMSQHENNFFVGRLWACSLYFVKYIK